MPANQEVHFSCEIRDLRSTDRFSAEVLVRKRFTVRRSSHDAGRIELADVFVTPISGLVSASANVHNHFVVFNYNGEGVYIVRDRFRRDEDRRYCSTWDLGDAFGRKVAEA